MFRAIKKASERNLVILTLTLIDFTASTEVVSSDLVGSPYAGIVDSKATIVQDNRCTIYVWYDNEAGYSHQVVRLLQHLTGLRYPALPE